MQPDIKYNMQCLEPATALFKKKASPNELAFRNTFTNYFTRSIFRTAL
jgi:hypothetical protein